MRRRGEWRKKEIRSFSLPIVNTEYSILRIDAPSTAIDVYLQIATSTGLAGAFGVGIYGILFDQRVSMSALIVRNRLGVQSLATGTNVNDTVSQVFQVQGVAVMGWEVTLKSTSIGNLGGTLAAVAHGVEANQ